MVRPIFENYDPAQSSNWKNTEGCIQIFNYSRKYKNNAGNCGAALRTGSRGELYGYLGSPVRSAPSPDTGIVVELPKETAISEFLELSLFSIFTNNGAVEPPELISDCREKESPLCVCVRSCVLALVSV